MRLSSKELAVLHRIYFAKREMRGDEAKTLSGWLRFCGGNPNTWKIINEFARLGVLRKHSEFNGYDFYKADLEGIVELIEGSEVGDIIKDWFSVRLH